MTIADAARAIGDPIGYRKIHKPDTDLRHFFLRIVKKIQTFAGFGRLAEHFIDPHARCV
jgi:uncharacterized protein (UPF0128 family)